MNTDLGQQHATLQRIARRAMSQRGLLTESSREAVGGLIESSHLVTAPKLATASFASVTTGARSRAHEIMELVGLRRFCQQYAGPGRTSQLAAALG